MIHIRTLDVFGFRKDKTLTDVHGCTSYTCDKLGLFYSPKIHTDQQFADNIINACIGFTLSSAMKSIQLSDVKFWRDKHK